MEHKPRLDSEQTEKILNLDNRWRVMAVYFVVLGILLLGAVTMPYSYDDPRLVTSFWTTEALVVLILMFATWWLFPGTRIGLRLPTLVNPLQLIPIGLLLLTAFGVWFYMRLTLQTTELINNQVSLHILRTTLLVGVSEEWMYRGLLLAAFSRWFGMRRGILLSLLLFGTLHLFNIVAGMSVQFAILQFFMTILIGASLALAAIASRTVLIPMVAHGLYDFCVIDTITTVRAGAPDWLILIITVVGIVSGLFSLAWLLIIEGSEPYPQAASKEA